MRDTLQRQFLAGVGEVAPVLAPLEWACDALVPDRHVLDQIEEVGDGSWEDADVVSVLVALVDFTTGHTADLDARLRELAPWRLTELAAAGRRSDRMCKAETKRRTKAEGES